MLLRTVIVIVFGFQIMLNLTRPIITLFASSLGAGTVEIGILTAAYAFFPLVLAIHIGKIADYAGDRLPAISGTLGMTIGISLPFCFPFMWSLYVSQAVVGISQIFINISLQNLIGKAATKETRDHYFSMFSMAVALGGVFGPVAGGYLAQHFSYSFAFLAATIVGLIPVSFSFFIPNIVGGKEAFGPKSGSALGLLRLPMLRKALASSALVLYSRDIFIAYFPLFANQLDMPTAMIGWILTIQGLTMVSVRLFLSKLTERMGRGRVLLASILLAGISFLLVPFTGHVVLLGILSALMGAGLGCGQPLSMTTTYNASPKAKTGEVLGLRLALNRLSQMLAPLIFGIVGSWAGLASIFVVSGAFLVGGAFLTRAKSGDEGMP